MLMITGMEVNRNLQMMRTRVEKDNSNNLQMVDEKITLGYPACQQASKGALVALLVLRFRN